MKKRKPRRAGEEEEEEEDEEVAAGRPLIMRGLKACTTRDCQFRAVSRDGNAAQNLYMLTMRMLAGEERPAAFTRATPPQSAARVTLQELLLISPEQRQRQRQRQQQESTPPPVTATSRSSEELPRAP